MNKAKLHPFTVTEKVTKIIMAKNATEAIRHFANDMNVVTVERNIATIINKIDEPNVATNIKTEG